MVNRRLRFAVVLSTLFLFLLVAAPGLVVAETPTGDLPKMVYHISKKFRDEARPRGGLIRLREFIMKDAYTLDRDEAALDEYYPSMIQALSLIHICAGRI